MSAAFVRLETTTMTKDSAPTTNAEYDARQAKIAEILSEIAEGSMFDAVSVHDLALAQEVIAAGKGSVTWSTAGESWARLCKAKPGSVYPPL